MQQWADYLPNEEIMGGRPSLSAESAMLLFA